MYWKLRAEAEIIFIEDVFENDKFMPFEQMMAKYKIPKKDFWQHLQLRSCIIYKENSP